MYSPDSDELKRKISRIAVIVLVIILIVFPLYMLVLRDTDRQPTAPRVGQDIPLTEIERMVPERRDTIDPPIMREEIAEPRIETMPPPIVEERIDRRPVPREREESPRRPAPQPSIAGDEALVFPQTLDSGSAIRSYRIRNTGDRALEVRRISVSGDNADAFDLRHSGSVTVQPNQEALVQIEFNPKTEGEKQATLSIESNDPRRSSLQVALRGLAISGESVDTIVRNLYEEGRSHFDSRRFRQAEELYTNVISLDPYYGPAYLMRGRSRFELGEYIAAISDFDDVLKYRLSLPSNDRQRIECITLYYAALSLSEQALRSENPDERNRLLRPALGRWEDFKGICRVDETLVDNAGYWMSRLSELR
jgi:hypothetical protein